MKNERHSPMAYIKNLKNTVFSEAHNTNTPEGRSKERNRRIAQSALAAMSARFSNIFTGLLTVPVTLPYLGIEQFGIWMALTGFIAFLSFSDLGLSIGLQTKLTQCHGKNEKSEPSFLISSTLVLIILIALILILIGYLVIPNVGVSDIIPVAKNNNQILIETTQYLIYTFSFGLFSTVIQRVFESYQDGLYSNLLLAFGRVFSLLSVYLCVYFELSLPVLIVFFMGFPFLFLFVGGIILLIKRPWLRPNISKVKLRYIKEILKIGCLAMSAQVGASVMSTGPLLVLTTQFGAAAIVPFALAQRLFGIVSMMLTMALSPLWPAYGEAKQRGDWVWIKSTLKKSTYLSTLIVIPFFIFMLFLGQQIILFWSQNEAVIPEFELILVCSIWMVLLAGVRVGSMFLNGLGEFKGQAVYGLVLPVIAVICGMQFSNTFSLIENLLLMILIGELTRLIAMKFEIRNILLGNQINDVK
jgi:O-antigen/teichoic acid export membrane protein